MAAEKAINSVMMAAEEARDLSHSVMMVAENGMRLRHSVMMKGL